MLLIRDTQLQALAQMPRARFIENMLSHLYTHFPAQAWLLTRDELRDQISELVDRAASYQLTSRQQVCRFINLAATYGWAFDSDPERSWMRDILTDTVLALPGERLDRLMKSCLHRQRVEQRNLAQRRALGLIPNDVSMALKPQEATDFSGLYSYTNTPPKRLDTDERLVDNPSDHRFSHALSSAEEFLLDD
ncbi:hypothetical protein [Pseudomonas putida]|uniref:Uncharacterized protein n=1 Tax=Pseudomonas putida TaxID=303 RepID=A0A1Q9QVK7_PSEPU|nr:hypothetical protein [Pseudomonas putida]OLS59168.1 hypothetical protein PSEMO_61290 [Pseudomonas putida]